jgi:hypothetical protein
MVPVVALCFGIIAAIPELLGAGAAMVAFGFAVSFSPLTSGMQKAIQDRKGPLTCLFVAGAG